MIRYSSNEQQSSSQPSQSYVQPQSLSAPFDFDSYSTTSPPTQHPSHLRPLTQGELSAFIQPHPNTSASLRPHLSLPNLAAPSPLGLPVYSASGFDLLSILARVANRPHPRVILGPVDMTCSFVVVDVRRYDHPIVYCSPTFCHLTGYSESEILGRNCRFLQAPNGQVQRGEVRHYTDPTAVAHLKKNLSADKECQTSIINYKKDGTAFMNLVTVIPILGGVSGAPHEDSEVVYHVGFQVDLTEQPNAILEKLRDGSYIVDYGSQRNTLSHPSPLALQTIGHIKDRKSQVIPSVRVSRDLKKLLSDPAFVKSIPISSSTTISPPQPSSSVRSEVDPPIPVTGSNQHLHLLLLEASPDFIHVVSLKGNFLYVAPSVRRVLGYEPEEMVGGSISDFAHPEDVIPLMRELKEGSLTGLAATSTDVAGSIPAAVVDATQAYPSGMPMAPRTVDLLFRARTKAGVYVWIECKGRLHVEPGKGRKAIVLSGRAKEMPKLNWKSVDSGGGLSMPVRTFVDGEEGRSRLMETEVWGMMSNGHNGGGVVSFVVVGSAVKDVLGWSPSELVGREIVGFVADGAMGLMNEIRELYRQDGGINPRRAYCKMRHKDGTTVDVIFAFFRPNRDSLSNLSVKGVVQAPLIYQLRSIQYFDPTHSSTSLAHCPTADVFEELDTNRDSSWQYEIQQIRFANQRLEEEISSLEKQLQDAEDVQQKVLEGLQQTPQHEAYAQTSQPSVTHPPGQFEYPSTSTDHHRYLSRHEQTPRTPIHQQQHYGTTSFTPSCLQPRVSPPTMSFSRDWDPSALFLQSQNQSSSRPQGLKRTWDVASHR